LNVPSRRILGIDPGLRLTGFGLIDRHEGGRLSYVASGVIRVPDGELADRLGIIYTQLREVIEQYSPDAAAVEKVFVNVNPASTLLLGQARGAALCALSTSALTVAEYTPMQIKQAVVGVGRATKDQVQAMMVRLLSLPGTPSRDAADALACATCHANTEGLAQSVSRVAGPIGPVRARGSVARRGVRMRGGRLVSS
jgi:crossover junction endodeoxyribonuclease RuvC